MAGSSFGTIFKCTTWGESHGKALGVVIDGCPAGIPLSEEDIQYYLNRRKPGQNPYGTKRNENDSVEILSGVFEGKTTGTPISLMVRNNNQQSKDYSEIANVYRPGHADYCFDKKYGFRDYRGGGRSSGRETIGRVAAGAVAMKLLNELGINIHAYARSIGPISIPEDITYKDIDINYALLSPTGMPIDKFSKDAEDYLKGCMEECDSAGGVIECFATNVPAGLGEPVFDKLDANLGKAMFSIGAVKAVEIGDGTKVSSVKGSENNDSFIRTDNTVETVTNHCGGILGGISNGSDIILRTYFKPTPSIFKEQTTINKEMEDVKIQIKGRHDPIIVPRAIVVVECMTAITLADMLLLNMSSNINNIKKIYE